MSYILYGPSEHIVGLGTFPIKWGFKARSHAGRLCYNLRVYGAVCIVENTCKVGEGSGP